MSIVDSIKTSKLNYQGQRPKLTQFGDKNSTQHYSSSINGQPYNGRIPSQLDLDGKTPPRYLDNPPK